MELPIYQVDAFATEVFKGNPAAVCPLESWLPEATLQAIAMENNLSETVFFVGGGGKYEIRWYTPTVEAKICGHATLAAAYVIFEFLEKGLRSVEFQSRTAGVLSVARDGRLLELDFPTFAVKQVSGVSPFREALGFEPLETWTTGKDRDFVVLANAEQVRALKIDPAPLIRSGAALCVTAPGDSCDYVYRFFAPAHGVPEDPVTGSANCVLGPYWSSKLGKAALLARQLSRRGGELRIRMAGDRVKIAGGAVLFLEGRIRI
jgi:PhzF family phenazine biosynthesis protein